MNDNKSERQKIIDRGNFGMYHKPLAQEIGLNAAIILDFLIYKYDYFVREKKEFVSYGKYKAFFITYQDIEDGTTIKVSTLSRNKASNPLVILEKYGLIKKAGASYSYLPPEGSKDEEEVKLGRGYDAARKKLAEETKLVKQLEKEIMKALKEDI